MIQTYEGGAIGPSELPWPKVLTQFTRVVWRNGVGMPPPELIPRA